MLLTQLPLSHNFHIPKIIAQHVYPNQSLLSHKEKLGRLYAMVPFGNICHNDCTNISMLIAAMLLKYFLLVPTEVPPLNVFTMTFSSPQHC